MIGTVEAMTVVEAAIEGVVTRESWAAAFESMGPCSVLLLVAGGERLLPIWIGSRRPPRSSPGGARQAPRPLGSDLPAALLGALGATLRGADPGPRRGHRRRGVTSWPAAVEDLASGDVRDAARRLRGAQARRAAAAGALAPAVTAAPPQPAPLHVLLALVDSPDAAAVVGPAGEALVAMRAALDG